MIVFENPGEIDVRSISTFGVSVKEGENPIGFFGTGLKYAIAVLLRTKHRVTIHSGQSVIRMGVSEETVRGQAFQFVTMTADDGAAVPIGFTTELGKQWELWMAYRELACNCKDEAGVGRYTTEAPCPQPGVTQIVVEGREFEEVFATGHLYILADTPQLTVGTTEIRNRPGRDLFYRGVRVHQFQRPGLYTYNINAKLSLTEDRTLAETWTATHHLAMAVLQSEDEAFLRDVLTAPDTALESAFDLHGWGIQPSPEFLRVVGSCVTDRRCKVNGSALKVWMDATKKDLVPQEISLTAVQGKSLERALTFCEQIGFRIRGSYPIKVVESLGDGILGLAENGTIFVAERVFHLGGAKQLASTLIEEYVHLKHGYKDMTRELQSFLFEKLVSVGEELVGEPL